MPRFRLLAIDLDGTLLDSQRRVPDVNRMALERAQHHGVKLAVVTGRRLPATRPSLGGLSLDLLMVLNGGALVKQGLDGPILKRELMPLALAEEVLALSDRVGVTPVVHDGPNGEGHLIIESGAPRNPRLDLYLDQTIPPPAWVPDLRTALKRDPVQIMFGGTIGEIRAAARVLEETLGSRISLARTEYESSDLALLDVHAPGASKKEALRFLAETQGILAHQIMAIGDNWNDLEMLEAAGFAVVMANASAELRARGFAITASNDEGGVAQAIERYVLSDS
jgi:hydroxymethylpyrimidine pyrophosphatase-like HAD family hydrolase